VVRPEGDVIRIAAETGGRVEVVHVGEGDIVQPGDTLVHLNDAEQQIRRQALTQQIAIREAQLRHFRHRLEALRRIHVADQLRLNAEIDATRDALEREQASLRARLEASVVTRAQAQHDHETTTALFDEGLVSREVWERSLTELRLSELDHERTATESPDWRAIALLERTREVGATQFDADREDLEAAIYPIDVELSRLRLELDHADREQTRLTIRSPARGQITLVESLHPGEYLAAGALIGTLEPTPATRIVEAILANRDSLDVHPGQTVKLLIDPSNIMDGTVESVSPDIHRSDALGGTYRVIIRPAHAEMRLGLAMEVRFLTRAETVLSLLVNRITRAFGQLGG
jgi:adhesin transport system membrane fusion protein